MLTIRLTRKGKKNQPFFRVVVIDKRRSSKGGRAVEEVGYVDPLTKRKSLKKERILHWIKNGAQPSATIHNLLVAEKIIDAPKINKFKKSKKVAAPAAGTPAAAPAGDVTPAEAKEAPKEEAKPQKTPVPEVPKEESKPEVQKPEEKPAA